MRKGILVIITTLLFIGVKGQDLDWMIQSENIWVADNNIAIDAAGNIYMIAGVMDTVDIDPGVGTTLIYPSGSNGYEAFLTKYDSQGNFLWVRVMSSTVSSGVYNFSVDDSGNSYISGSFRGEIDFDNGISTDNLIGINLNGTGFLAKYDSNGNFLWSKISSDQEGVMYSQVNVTSNSEFLLYGFYNALSDFDLGSGTHFESVFDSEGGVYVAKYDGNANLIWVRTVSDGERKWATWAGEKNGEVYLSAGYVNGFDTLVIPPDTIIRSMNDYFILKYDVNGSVDWNISVGGNGNEYFKSYVLDDSGNLYVAGNFQNTVDFNPGGTTNNLSSIGKNDMFVSKYNSSGVSEWTCQISDVQDTSTDINHIFNPAINQVLSMAYDSQEGLLVSGHHYSELEVNHNGGMTLLPDIVGEGAFVMNFDENGNYNFGETISSSLYDIHGHGIVSDNNGSFYLSGHYGGTVDFDMGVGIYNASTGSREIFLAKYSFNAIGIDENGFDADFSLYPNPASNNITIDFESEEQFVNLQIINIRGQQIFIKEYKNTKNVQLNIEDFSSGVYFVKIITNNGFKTVKFVKK
ncbi:MAG: hypothetical protein COB15_15710 [Flavobacteriales bacterium]|nr:MAG: hypothetical protein COB15_15710 [Flavobacteriales bacterium]